MKNIQADGGFDKSELTHVEKTCKDIWSIVKALREIDNQLGIILHTLSTMKDDNIWILLHQVQILTLKM